MKPFFLDIHAKVSTIIAPNYKRQCGVQFYSYNPNQENVLQKLEAQQQRVQKLKTPIFIKQIWQENIISIKKGNKTYFLHFGVNVA